MTVTELSGIELQARDWDRLLRWYQDVLGLRVLVVEDDDRFAMLQASSGGAILHLASDHPEFAASESENRCGAVFSVDDFDAALERFRAAGVRVDPVIDGADEGYRLARIWDPENNRIHVTPA